jgi:hypothetical protein
MASLCVEELISHAHEVIDGSGLELVEFIKAKPILAERLV